jgi:hypothetical protein
MKNTLIALFVLVFTLNLTAQTVIIPNENDSRVITTGVPFVLIAPDARAAGMGDQGVATSVDAFSQQWNSSKYVFSEAKSGIGVSYTPYLSQLVNDNMEYKEDFRGIYASVMENWLCVNSNLVNEALLNVNYQRVNLGVNCSALGVGEFNQTRFKHFVIYPNNDTILKFINPFTQHTVVKLYDIMGREIATLKNEILFAGEHSIDIKKTVKSRLSIGQYIYKISVGSQDFSKSLLIR